MQTRCSHDVRATGRHLRLDMMTHRDSFPILHNFYRLRYIIVSFRAHPSTPKNSITEDSCILQYLRSLRSERADVAGSTDCGTVPTLMCKYFSPGEYTEYKVKSYSVQNFRTLRSIKPVRLVAPGPAGRPSTRYDILIYLYETITCWSAGLSLRRSLSVLGFSHKETKINR